MTASARRVAGWAYIQISLNSRRPRSSHDSTPDQLTSARCLSAWQPNPRGGPTLSMRKRPEPAQTLLWDIPMRTLCPSYNSPICRAQPPTRSVGCRARGSAQHVRQADLRSTVSMDGGTVVRLTVYLWLLSPRKLLSISRNNWQLRTPRGRAKPKRCR